MTTGEVITQRLRTVATDFLQEVGIVKKTPKEGTLMLVTHREAVQMLVAEREKELAVLRLELLGTCLEAHIMQGRRNREDMGVLMWLQKIVIMGKPELRERWLEMGLSEEMAKEI